MFPFNALSFVVRWLLSMLIVFATYNPTGFSYYHWIFGDVPGDWAAKTLIGCFLLIIYGVFGMCTWRSMGPYGIATATLSLTVLVWMIQDYGLINLNQTHTVSAVTCSLIATVMAFGVTVSHIKTRLYGQTESNYVEYY